MGHGLAMFGGAVLLKHFGVQPRGAVGESEQFENLWLVSAIGIVLPVFSLLLVWLGYYVFGCALKSILRMSTF